MEKLLIFLFGGVIGAGVSWYFTKRHYRKILDRREDLIADLTEEVDSESFQCEKIRNKVEDIENMAFDDGVDYCLDFLHDICRDDEEEIEILVKRLQKLGVGVSYSDDEECACDVNPTDDDDSIYIIDEKEYTENDSFTKDTVIFYEDDQTFVDPESSNIIESWKEIFGYDILNWIEDHNWRKENLYVRNMRYSSDYQIVLKHTSYAAENGEAEDEDLYSPGDFADKK